MLSVLQIASFLSLLDVAEAVNNTLSHFFRRLRFLVGNVNNK